MNYKVKRICAKYRAAYNCLYFIASVVLTMVTLDIYLQFLSYFID